MKKVLLLSSFVFGLMASLAQGQPTNTPTEGSSAKSVTLEGDNGGLVKDGSAWKSDAMQGFVTLLVYVDPDESELNDAFTERLKKEDFGPQRFKSYAIINMAATWKPNFAISSVLTKKQEQYQHTTYVKDYKKTLVTSWGLKDDGYEVILFDKAGKVLFRRQGKISPEDTELFVKLARENLPPL